jgi:site-specific DNA recombinase
MRAVVYARYSSDLQREASIEDQIEVCRRYAEAQGWTVVGTYKDAAISGASRFRPGLQKLIADAAGRRFDVVICEAIDRLGRRLADTADLQDWRFRGSVSIRPRSARSRISMSRSWA